MFLEGAIYTSKILEHPEAMDDVEDPYIIVIEDPLFRSPFQYKQMISVMTLMHARGWETVNTSFEPTGQMVALLKNPRAKPKNAGDA